MQPVNRDAILSVAFLDELVKRSPEAEDVLRDSGRIRLQRTALAVVELYVEQNIHPVDTRQSCPTCGEKDRITDYGRKMHPQLCCDACGQMFDKEAK